MMEFMQDDLPDPVAPEMSTWGISARLTMTARPAMSRPMATSSGGLAGVRTGLLGIQDVGQGHQLAGAVGHLDADGRLARDGGEDAHVGRGHGVGDVLGQAGHPGHLDAGPELELEAGDRRAHPGADEAGLHAVGGQGTHQLHPGGVGLLLVLLHLLGFVQQRPRRQRPAAGAMRHGRDGRRLDRLGFGLRLDRARASGSGMSMSLSSTGSGSGGGPTSAKGETGAGEAGSSSSARAAS